MAVLGQIIPLVELVGGIGDAEGVQSDPQIGIHAVARQGGQHGGGNRRGKPTFGRELLGRYPPSIFLDLRGRLHQPSLPQHDWRRRFPRQSVQVIAMSRIPTATASVILRFIQHSMLIRVWGRLGGRLPACRHASAPRRGSSPASDPPEPSGQGLVGLGNSRHGGCVVAAGVRQDRRLGIPGKAFRRQIDCELIASSHFTIWPEWVAMRPRIAVIVLSVAQSASLYA